MAKKPKIDVVLTTAALQEVDDQGLRLFLKEDRYFNCDAVDQDGPFLHLKLTYMKGLQKLQAVITIPSHFVLYMISADARAVLGFEGGRGRHTTT